MYLKSASDTCLTLHHRLCQSLVVELSSFKQLNIQFTQLYIQFFLDTLCFCKFVALDSIHWISLRYVCDNSDKIPEFFKIKMQFSTNFHDFLEKSVTIASVRSFQVKRTLKSVHKAIIKSECGTNNFTDIILQNDDSSK